MTVAASVAYLSEGLVAWEFVALMVAFNTAGAFVGSRLALTKGAKVIRPMFLAILVLLFVRLVWDLVM